VQTQTCTSCKRTMEEIVEAGMTNEELRGRKGYNPGAFVGYDTVIDGEELIGYDCTPRNEKLLELDRKMKDEK
jgi:hypothetical protein